MPHNSAKWKQMKRERTHAANNKYNRHGQRKHHRGHRDFPLQRGLGAFANLADMAGAKSIDYNPDGSVRAVVYNIPKMRKYAEEEHDRKELQNILEDIDRREKALDEQEATQPPAHVISSFSSLPEEHKEPAVPMAALYSANADNQAAFDSLNNQIASLKSTLDSVVSSQKKQQAAQSKNNSQNPYWYDPDSDVPMWQQRAIIRHHLLLTMRRTQLTRLRNKLAIARRFKNIRAARMYAMQMAVLQESIDKEEKEDRINGEHLHDKSIDVDMQA